MEEEEKMVKSETDEKILSAKCMEKKNWTQNGSGSECEMGIGSVLFLSFEFFRVLSTSNSTLGFISFQSDIFGIKNTPIGKG